jgi:hypothetical protein
MHSTLFEVGGSGVQNPSQYTVKKLLRFVDDEKCFKSVKCTCLLHCGQTLPLQLPNLSVIFFQKCVV